MMLKKIALFLVACFLVQVITAQERKIIRLPDIPGFQTLKCDFHLHTVFSDGTVWPTVRVEEAWKEGLDAIAISDHIEYRPHSTDIVADHNRSYEIARPLAANLNIILIKAAEITRSMPPGHLNALFIKNANLLEREDVFEALQEARDQGAFIFWNHPGWKVQQPDSMLWWNEHTRLLKADRMHGIEIYNSNEAYPEAFDWAKKRNLTVFANSDLHGPASADYDLNNGHRPITLVFAKSRTEGGIREALFARRTIAWYDNVLIGRHDLLESFFLASLKIPRQPLRLQNEDTRYVEVQNRSDIDYYLELVQPGVGFDAPETLLLKANHSAMIELTGNSDEVATSPELKMYYQVKNMFVGSDDNLIITFSLSNL